MCNLAENQLKEIINMNIGKKLKTEITKNEKLENEVSDPRAKAYYKGKKQMAEDIALYLGVIKKVERITLN